MREVIHDIRKVQGRNKSYEYLVKVYFEWAKKTYGNGEWEKGINLGPKPKLDHLGWSR